MAGEATFNLERVATLPKPDGFFDPHAPGGLPMPTERVPEEEEVEEDEADEAAEDEEDAAPPARRSGILNFANSDLAFAGDVLFEGNFHGFNTYNVEDPLKPQRNCLPLWVDQGDGGVVGSTKDDVTMSITRIPL